MPQEILWRARNRSAPMHSTPLSVSYLTARFTARRHLANGGSRKSLAATCSVSLRRTLPRIVDPVSSFLWHAQRQAFFPCPLRSLWRGGNIPFALIRLRQV